MSGFGFPSYIEVLVSLLQPSARCCCGPHLGLPEKAGFFKNWSPPAVHGWFAPMVVAPLVVDCFVGLGLSALLSQPGVGPSGGGGV